MVLTTTRSAATRPKRLLLLLLCMTLHRIHYKTTIHIHVIASLTSSNCRPPRSANHSDIIYSTQTLAAAAAVTAIGVTVNCIASGRWRPHTMLYAVPALRRRQRVQHPATFYRRLRGRNSKQPANYAQTVNLISFHPTHCSVFPMRTSTSA